MSHVHTVYSLLNKANRVFLADLDLAVAGFAVPFEYKHNMLSYATENLPL